LEAVVQPFQHTDQRIQDRFRAKLAATGLPGASLRMSWSNWMFGAEPLALGVARLARNGIPWIELHGNHYGPDLGYDVAETRRILADHGVAVSGVCGMFNVDNDLSSASGGRRQAAIDYIKRTVAFCAEVGGNYVLTVPGAVGHPRPVDGGEFKRSVTSLRRVAEVFAQHHIRCAIEPIRADEVGFCHTIADAQAYLAAVDHPWVRWINGDVYHMLHGEPHVGGAILDAGEALINLHLADTNRGALGDGMLDLDTMIKALYAIGYPDRGGFCTAEPLGAGSDPYQRMHLDSDPAGLDQLVERTVAIVRAQEAAVRREAMQIVGCQTGLDSQRHTAGAS
jgi:D-psicose/D-tagatose/L-ribulose 3-epimerase